MGSSNGKINILNEDTPTVKLIMNATENANNLVASDPEFKKYAVKDLTNLLLNVTYNHGCNLLAREQVYQNEAKYVTLPAGTVLYTTYTRCEIINCYTLEALLQKLFTSSKKNIDIYFLQLEEPVQLVNGNSSSSLLYFLSKGGNSALKKKLESEFYQEIYNSIYTNPLVKLGKVSYKVISTFFGNEFEEAYTTQLTNNQNLDDASVDATKFFLEAKSLFAPIGFFKNSSSSILSYSAVEMRLLKNLLPGKWTAMSINQGQQLLQQHSTFSNSFYVKFIQAHRANLVFTSFVIALSGLFFAVYRYKFNKVRKLISKRQQYIQQLCETEIDIELEKQTDAVEELYKLEMLRKNIQLQQYYCTPLSMFVKDGVILNKEQICQEFKNDVERTSKIVSFTNILSLFVLIAGYPVAPQNMVPWTAIIIGAPLFSRIIAEPVQNVASVEKKFKLLDTVDENYDLPFLEQTFKVSNIKNLNVDELIALMSSTFSDFPSTLVFDTAGKLRNKQSILTLVSTFLKQRNNLRKFMKQQQQDQKVLVFGEQEKTIWNKK